MLESCFILVCGLHHCSFSFSEARKGSGLCIWKLSLSMKPQHASNGCLNASKTGQQIRGRKSRGGQTVWSTHPSKKTMWDSQRILLMGEKNLLVTSYQVKNSLHKEDISLSRFNIRTRLYENKRRGFTTRRKQFESLKNRQERVGRNKASLKA